MEERTMLTRMIPNKVNGPAWVHPLLMIIAGSAVAQEPAGCTGDDFVAGVNWSITDDGAGRAYALGEGGVFTSCNDGETWMRPDTARASGMSLLVDPADRSTIYYGTWERGIYRSTDHGATFSQVGASEIVGDVVSIAAKADGTILAGSRSGIFATNDRGVSWTLINGSPAGAAMHALLVDPGNDNVLYAGTNGNGAFRTLDGGNSWERMGTFTQVSDLEFHPDNTSIVYAAAWDGVWQSVDAGTTWTNIGGIRNSDFAFDPTNSSIAYRTSRLDGVHKSVDGAQTWSPINNGLGAVINDIYSVHVLPSGTVLVGTEFDGVFRSIDGGASWAPAGSQAADGTEPPASGNDVYKTARLAVTIKFRGDNGAIKAGKDAAFKVTIKNNGPDASTNTTVSFDWSREVFLGSPQSFAYSMSTNHGRCSASYSVPDCSLGTIPSGGSAVIEFVGKTERNKQYTFNLDVLADNAETDVSVYATKAIRTKVEYTCVLIFCTTDSGSGGGAADWWLLLLLGGAIGCRRFGSQAARHAN
jgi:photosystem II stability/assembly factor-like uncharacterized protein